MCNGMGIQKYRIYYCISPNEEGAGKDHGKGDSNEVNPSRREGRAGAHYETEYG